MVPRWSMMKHGVYFHSLHCMQGRLFECTSAVSGGWIPFWRLRQIRRAGQEPDDSGVVEM